MGYSCLPSSFPAMPRHFARDILRMVIRDHSTVSRQSLLGLSYGTLTNRLSWRFEAGDFGTTERARLGRIIDASRVSAKRPCALSKRSRQFSCTQMSEPAQAREPPTSLPLRSTSEMRDLSGSCGECCSAHVSQSFCAA